MNISDIKNIDKVNFENLNLDITIEYSDKKSEKINFSLNSEEDLTKIEAFLDFLKTYNLEDKCAIKY